MGILTPKRGENALKKIDLKKITLIASFFIMVGVISFATGYFILDSMTGGSRGGDGNSLINNTASAKTSGQSGQDKVNENTKMVKIDIYMRGNTYDCTVPTQATQELIGKSMDEIKEYFSKEGYVLKKFTTDEVVLQRVVVEKDKWPPNCSVLISDASGNIMLYQTDESGKLGTPENLEVNISILPEPDAARMKLGYIYDDPDKLAEHLEGLE